MINESGTLIFNGIADAELVKILQIKEKHEQHLDFTPQQMQPQATNQPGQPARKFYNNVRLDWRARDGLKAAFQIVEALLEEEKREQMQ